MEKLSSLDLWTRQLDLDGFKVVQGVRHSLRSRSHLVFPSSGLVFLLSLPVPVQGF